MMMIQRQYPTVEIPPWDPLYDDPTASILFSPPTTNYNDSYDSDTESDSFSSDYFRMFEFKIRKCARGRSHDWTECPYAHPGEKACRRDPRNHHYSGYPCPEFRRGTCRKGDSCEFAHGVFECWLHPARYRTQPCKDGVHCKRRVCFFAHSPEQVRVIPNSDSPSSRLGGDSFELDSPPISPSYDITGAMRALQIGKMSMSPSPRSAFGFGSGSGFVPRAGFGSPRSPSTGFGIVDPWEIANEEEPFMERVESGKGIRARMYAKLSKENSLVGNGPDFGWVSDLVK